MLLFTGFSAKLLSRRCADGIRRPVKSKRWSPSIDNIDPVEYFQTRAVVTIDQAKFHKTNDGSNYIQCGVILSPARESGYVMCTHCSPGCESACLKSSGQLVFSTAKRARILRTRLFLFHRAEYLAYVERDLTGLRKKAHAAGKILVTRFDTLSDTNTLSIYRDLMMRHEMDGFVDYTKDPRKYSRWLSGEAAPNHHLTFSRSETNASQARYFVAAGGTATVVCRDHATMSRYLEEGYLGFPCVDGTLSDRRWEDPKGHWVLLVALGKAKEDRTGFVVD